MFESMLISDLCYYFVVTKKLVVIVDTNSYNHFNEELLMFVGPLQKSFGKIYFTKLFKSVAVVITINVVGFRGNVVNLSISVEDYFKCINQLVYDSRVVLPCFDSLSLFELGLFELLISS